MNKKYLLLYVIFLSSYFLSVPVLASNESEDTTVEVNGTETTENSQKLVYSVKAVVVLRFDDGSFRYERVSVGSPIGEPVPPEREGFRFLGWYNPETNEKWDFSKPVSNHMALEARYERISDVIDTSDSVDIAYYAEMLIISILVSVSVFEGKNAFWDEDITHGQI